LGVGSVEIHEAEPEPITNEHIKAALLYLWGTITEGFADTSACALAPSDIQLTKFHGAYRQDDRNEAAYVFMIRVRLVECVPRIVAIDEIADEHGRGDFKITTRQTIQFHGIVKRYLKLSMQTINRTFLDTLAT
jgi:sulfite reductase (NADPH) hemoprotein beta-component